MILETLDVKKNDIFVYSLNKFDFNRNFKLINKDDSIKHPKSIHFNEICRLLTDGRPKNVVVYRLLTNLPQMDHKFLKYGFVLNVAGNREVVYFDPCFAIKELEEYSNIADYPFLRFRVQQVGLLSMLTSFGEPRFQEVYAFDMEPAEVRWQNDRVFAEIIFAFDDVNFDEEDVMFPGEVNKIAPKRKFVAVTSEDVKTDFIEEDSTANAAALKKLRAIKNHTSETLANSLQGEMRKRLTIEETEVPLPHPKVSFGTTQTQNTTETKEAAKTPAPIPEAAPKPAEQNKPTFGQFLTKVKKDISQEDKEKSTTGKNDKQAIISIFKTSAHIQGFVEDRGKKQVVLKLRKQE